MSPKYFPQIRNEKHQSSSTSQLSFKIPGVWTVVIVVVVIKVVVVSSSPGGDVAPPFLPDWPDLGADEEVMAVVRTPGDIIVKAGSTDGTA